MLEPCADDIVLAAASPSILVGGGGAQLVPENRRRWRPKIVFSKTLEKISFYLQNFLMTFFSHQIFGGGAPINKSRRRRPQIVGGGAAGARL